MSVVSITHLVVILSRYEVIIVNPCHQNRGKIGEYIAIPRPINREIYRDKSRFRQKSVVNSDLIDDYFLENRPN